MAAEMSDPNLRRTQLAIWALGEARRRRVPELRLAEAPSDDSAGVPLPGRSALGDPSGAVATNVPAGDDDPCWRPDKTGTVLEPAEVAAVVSDQDRVEALRRLVLLDSSPSVPFDRVAAMAARLLGASAAVTLVDLERLWLMSAVGLPRKLAKRRQIPLTHAFCHYTVAAREPVVIGDTRRHPHLSDHPAVSDFGVAAYAGAPVFAPSGHAVGAVAALTFTPRAWTESDLRNLVDLADIATLQIDLHSRQLREARQRMWSGVHPSRGARRW